MNLSMCLALVSFVVIFKESQTVPWCYSLTKRYTKTIQVPVKICREVNIPDTKSPLDSPGRPLSPIRTVSTPLRGDSLTAKQVMEMFPGLFLNQTNAKEVDTEMNIFPSIRGRPAKPSVDHDGDLHCPTFKNLEAAPDNLKNIRQEPKEIVHFSSEGVYQYVHKGTCGSDSTQSCTGGGCHQERSIVYLMVWQDNPDWPTGFEPFEVDSYCSCKGITS